MCNDEVSFIIVTCNRSELLTKSIKSIVCSRKISLKEIIIIDDGSSVPIKAENFTESNKISVVTLPEHKGVAYARNEGIKRTKTQLNICIDDDVCLFPEAAYKMIYALKDYDLVHTLPYWKDRGPMANIEWIKSYPKITPCWGFKRDSLNMLDELFDTTYTFAFEDMDFFYRCMLFNLSACFLPQCLSEHIDMDLNRDSTFRFICSFKHNLYFNFKLRRFKSFKTKKYFKNYPTLNLNYYIKSALFNYDAYKCYFDTLKSGKNKKSLIEKVKEAFNTKYKINYTCRIVIFIKLFLSIFSVSFYFPKAIRKQKQIIRKLKKYSLI